MKATRWLSATSAGRLLRCPVSASYTTDPFVPPPSEPRNAGSLAHLAMGAWLETDAWREADSGATLRRAWDREAAQWSIEPSSLEDAVMTRSRLRRRGPELAGLLSRSGSNPRSEVQLRDDARRVYGQLDVVVDGAGGGAVVDLKTGDDGSGEVGEDARTQLLIYAHLFGQEYGHLPAALVVFSLRYGAVPLEFTQSDVDSLLARIDDARGAMPPMAIPDRVGCRYCHHRLRCEPHWEAASTWEDSDCVEGRIVKVETSIAGLTSLRIATARGKQWVTGLTSSGDVAVGQGAAVRITEVSGRGEGDERDWRATRFTRTLVVST
ncbi:MAG: PD-(D/E)XK nuclease family protein [Herbiconiux sp.]|nr:PD-(D/E)XK nuclease family protein [Herbiconiux sp.]